MSDGDLPITISKSNWGQSSELTQDSSAVSQNGGIQGRKVNLAKSPSDNSIAPLSDDIKPEKRLTLKEKIKGAHSDSLSYVTKTFPKPISKIIRVADKIFVGVLKAIKAEAEIWTADLLVEYDWPEDDVPAKQASKSERVSASPVNANNESPAKSTSSERPTRAKGPIRPKSWEQATKKINPRLSKTPAKLDWAKKIENFQRVYDDASVSYTVQGGFRLEEKTDEAVKALNFRSAPMWVEQMVKYQPLDDVQIDKDAARSVTKVGSQEPTTGPEKTRAAQLKKNLLDEIKKENPELDEDKVSKIQRFILERLSETNTNVEAMAAVSLGFGNRELVDVLPDSDPSRVDVKEVQIEGQEITITVPSRWKLSENALNPESDLRIFGKVDAIYVFKVSVDDILKDKANIQVADITVTKFE